MSSDPPSHTFKYPSNFSTLPFTRKSYVRSAAFAAISTVVWSKTAGVIWLDTNFCQISLYSLYCSSLKLARIDSGVKSTRVGRIASCASCACACRLPANSFAFSGRYCLPSFAMYSRASTIASGETRVESVLIYVISPTVPSSPISTPSYNRCATPIVRRTLKPSRLDASCCSLLVIYGAVGFARRSFFSTPRTLHLRLLQLSQNLLDSLLVRQRTRKKLLLALCIDAVRDPRRNRHPRPQTSP